MRHSRLLREETIVASTSDVRSQRTHIGKGIQFKGEISGNEDVYIDGRMEGVISLPGQAVTVGPNGDVRANANLREILVQGKLEGTVAARERVEIAATGAVNGELTTARIAVHDGAFFKGKIDVVKGKEEARIPAYGRPQAAAASAPVSQPPAPASSGAASGDSSSSSSTE
jgi:cytoskeletal protein CcmA (bactofilin family)